ncbi:MAG: VIT1/CCC1 transporter family protein [Candidatus Spechtbacterales bacterium]|nr:VIT1/CCC1 transporter family protein [Candidatus Spechtbacterales bacterium]
MKRKISRLFHEFLEDSVYAAFDGIVTSLGSIAAIIGAGLNPLMILVIGGAKLVADSLSMTGGDWNATDARHERYETVLEEELAFLREAPSDARRIIRLIFIKQGCTPRESRELAEALTKTEKLYGDFVMSHIHGLTKTDAKDKWWAALVTFVSFIVPGALPLIPFAVLNALGIIDPLWGAVILTSIALFIVGSIHRASYSKKWWRGGINMLISGLLASTGGYLIGSLLENVLL